MGSMNPRYSQQAGLEVVPPETGLYPLPTPTPLYPAPVEPLPDTPSPNQLSPNEASPNDAFTNQLASKEQITSAEPGGNQQTPAQIESQAATDGKRRILGLSVPVFWALIVTLFVILAAGIGGGVGGGLSAQQKSSAGSDTSSGGSNNNNNNNNNNGGGTASSTAPSPTTSSTTDTLVPTDGCPGINSVGYTPYSADGQPIPLQAGDAPQQFQEQCWTNWANTASTHDILRTYTPTLENCITVCAEYNKAYLTNLKNNNGVAGGPCVAVTIVKEHAGFCYLKNGTGTNNTMGNPGGYSSAILLTDVNSLLST
ncbi:putative membrane protein insertase [Rosellinia necatrix]|uniref:Putative membrane protein insertase n=1 Tax=Rosellinia necatrix TaxID=77044 RepID=A0A1W2TU38_ROSNE|nr:putative membrane protein insertase [Rosellinia necatrix]